MASPTSVEFSLPEVDERPNQPMHFKFPKRPFGKTKVVNRSFQNQWFEKWRWLHYDESRDLAFCHTCVVAMKTGKMKNAGTVDSAFVFRGYCNWKDTSGEKGAFNNHEHSTVHKKAVELVVTLPKSTRDVGELLSSAHAQEKRANRQYLLKVIQNVRFLARQGLALRGDGDEQDSNFTQLLHLRSKDDPTILQYLKKKTDKYCSPQIQNELLQVMSLKVTREIASAIRAAGYYTLMADEVTDSSNREQVVVCLRWIDDDFDPHEDFIGLHKVESTGANVLVAVLKDTLLRMNLKLANCRGQCYDGAANMAGCRSGVATQIAAEEVRAVYTHCYGHALNLAAGDTVRQSRLLRDTLDTTGEMSKLLKYSPRRDSLFEKLKSEISPSQPGFRTLCPTRWTVKAASLESVVINYTVLQQLWEEALNIATDSEARARIMGVQAQMDKFEYLFGLVLGECVLKHTDNLSKTLQSPSLSAAEGQRIAELTCKTLERIRNDECYGFFGEKVLQLQEQLGVNEPAMPRRRKAPCRYEIGTGEGHFPGTPKQFFRQKYLEALDLVVNFIRQRFDQPGYGVYRHLQDLLLRAAKCEDYTTDFEFVVKFYGDDLHPSPLKAQLELFGTSFWELVSTNPTLRDITEYFKSLSPAARGSMSEVCTLLRILLVMPATNAVSERSASALRRVKTYLRTTMSQARLNSLMTLHIHKEKTDNLLLETCLNDFVAGNEHRLTLFGTF